MPTKMSYCTPLRYPGGKRRLAPVVMSLLEKNNLRDVQYVEPYAGGAAIAIELLLQERASYIHMNDLSRPVYAFWHAVLNNTSDLCLRIERVKVTVKEWHKQRATYDRRDTVDINDLGFAAFFLNRTNRSGIIGGGVIGGKEQTGAWSLDVRFNKADLIQRIKRISRYKNRIRLYQLDALKFTNQVLSKMGSNTFVFYDPPYIENGKSLYLNDYNLEGHRLLANNVSKLKQSWVVTYDYAAVQAKLYPSHRRIVYGLSYTAQDRYKGKEVMFLSNSLELPTQWQCSTPVLLNATRKEHRIYGVMEQY